MGDLRVRIPDEMEQQIATAAKAEMISRSDIVRRALIQYFKREQANRTVDAGETYSTIASHADATRARNASGPQVTYEEDPGGGE